jgi:hypothetical protein
MYDQSQNNLKFFGSKKTKGPNQNSQLKSAKVTYARGGGDTLVLIIIT